MKKNMLYNSRIDLHTHSTASDGQHTPTELVQMAAQNCIHYLAITDHDTVDGIAEGRAAAQQKGVHVISGIEISVRGNREMHLLGYGIDENDMGIVEMCRIFRQQRDERKYRILEYLKGYGILLQLEVVEQYAENGLIARPHFARAMVEAGYVNTVREAFDCYLGTEAFDKVERPKPQPEEAIAIIHAAGGLAVLAHPAKLKLSPAQLEQMVQSLCTDGLDGIECWYSSHTNVQAQQYVQLAHRYHLYQTIGSDFHGVKVKPEISLGMNWQDGVEEFLNQSKK